MAIACHRKSHHNFAWCPIPQPPHTMGEGGGHNGVRCRKKTGVGKNLLSAHVENTRTMRSARPFPSLCTSNT